jgi:uncharacterized protein (TIGR02246 family)
MLGRSVIQGMAALIAMIFAQNGTSLAGPPDADEQARAAVRGLIDKFNASWDKENGPTLIGEVLSDKAFVLLRPDKQPGEPARARVQNKQEYIEGYKKFVLNANLQKHEHQIKSVAVMGPIAYEFGVIIDVSQEGEERRGDVLNVFAKEDVGWRLVFSTSPEFFERKPTDSAEDEKAVCELARSFVATFRSKRPTPFEQFGNMLADDVVIISSMGETRTGKKAVVDYYREQLAEFRQKVSKADFSWEGMTVRMMGDGAVVFGKLVSEIHEKEGDRPIHREIWETLVFRKEANGWWLIEEQSTLAPAESTSKN